MAQCVVEQRYWLPDKTHGYVQGHCVEVDDTNTRFETVQDEEAQISAAKHSLNNKECQDLGLITDEQLRGIDNVTDLEIISEGALLNTVRIRYYRDEIYTNVARIVLAVNPFRPLRLYDAAFVEKYNTEGRKEPHVFGVGSDAFYGLMHNRQPQAVLISGESGAGKTESTKHILAYLADVAGNAELAIENKILATNPLMEAFGNCKTRRNNNSSRFGKWMQICFQKSMHIEGAQITDYLLEQTRIVIQPKEERNYHIFYQLLAGSLSDTYTEKFKIEGKKPEDYEFLRHSAGFNVVGIDDAATWQETKQAFDTMGFPQAETLEFLQVCVGILNMGNITFKPDKSGEGSEVVSKEAVHALNECARLLGLEGNLIDDLRSALTKRPLKIAGEITFQMLSTEKAIAAKEAIVKIIYVRMFKMLIAMLNRTLAPGAVINSENAAPASAEEVNFIDRTLIDGKSHVAEVGDNYIGVLDIAGFESFDVNSLEQLFINLSNETLQMYFNETIFTNELQEYKEEGISIANITYRDNSDILELVSGKQGLLDMLDEEVNIARATHDTYVSKCSKKYEKHERFVKNKFNRPLYSINHFAGTVEYNCEGWLEKNLDEAPKELADLLSKSTLRKVRHIGEALLASHVDSNAAGVKKKTTVSKVFRASLKTLIDEVGSCQAHFVRCIKPNFGQKPRVFEGKSVLEQLLYSGAMEAVKIRQAGYPYRMLHGDFCKKFFLIMPIKLRYVIVAEAEGKDVGEITSKDIMRERLLPILSSEKGIKTFVKYLPEICATKTKGLPERRHHHGVMDNADKDDWKVGKTKVFMKIAAQHVITSQLNIAQTAYVIILQKCYRGFTARKSLRAVKEMMAAQKDIVRNHSGMYGIYYDNSDPSYKVKDELILESRKRKEPPKSGIAVIVGGTLNQLLEMLEKLEIMILDARKLKVIPKSTLTIEEMVSKLKLECKLHEYMESGKLKDSEDVAQLNELLGIFTTLNLVDQETENTKAQLEKRKQTIQYQMPILEFIEKFGSTEDVEKLERCFEEVEGLPNFNEEYYEDIDNKTGFWLRDTMAHDLKFMRRRLIKLKGEDDIIINNESSRGDDGLQGADNIKAEAGSSNKSKLDRRGTLMATEMDVMRIMGQLHQAQLVLDYDTLVSTVSNAISKGIKPNELEIFDTRIRELQDPEYIQRAMNLEVNKLVSTIDNERETILIEKGIIVPSKTQLARRQFNLGNVEVMNTQNFTSEAGKPSPSMMSGMLGADGAKTTSMAATVTAKSIPEDEEVEDEEEKIQEAIKKDEADMATDKQLEGLDAEQIKTITMARVLNLLKRAKNLNFSPEKLDAVNNVLQDSLKASSFNTGKEGDTTEFSIYFQNDIADPSTPKEQIANGSFGDLYNYPKLRERKPLRDLETGRDQFLDWQQTKLLTPMTWDVPTNHSTTVLQSFRNILGWCNDRPVQDQKRTQLAFAICSISKSELEIRSEIYIQVLKQLRNNPNARSEMLGWKLLSLLCQQAAPHSELLDFVLAFLKKAYADNRLTEERLEYSHVVAECWSGLKCTLDKIDKHELEALGYIPIVIDESAETELHKKTNTVKLEIFTMDCQSRKLRCKRPTTIRELTNKVMDLLHMQGTNASNANNHGTQYGFFQLVDDVVETHRVIPDNITIGELGDKWEQLAQKSGKHSRLLFKRLYLTRTEELPLYDPVACDLAFRQAYFEYLRYPVAETWKIGKNRRDHKRLLYGIACSIMAVDLDTFLPFLAKGPEGLIGVLERILPTVYMTMMAKKNGPLVEEERPEEMRLMEKVIHTNAQQDLPTNLRMKDYKYSKLIVPALVNDPVHKNLQMVNSKTFPQIIEMEKGHVLEEASHQDAKFMDLSVAPSSADGNKPVKQVSPKQIMDENMMAGVKPTKEEREALNKTQSNSQTSALLAHANAGLVKDKKVCNLIQKQSPPFVTGDHEEMPTYLEMAQEIYEMYQEQFQRMDDTLPLAKMSQAFALFQQMTYFGSYFYAVREMERDQVEGKKIDTNVPLNHIDPNSATKSINHAYWICISLDGVTFLGRDKGKTAITFERTFYYFRLAATCLTKWGAKDNCCLLQLREPGRHYVALFLSRMALDIAYAMFRCSKSAKIAKK